MFSECIQFDLLDVKADAFVQPALVGYKNRRYQLGVAVRGYRDLNSEGSKFFSIQAKGGQHSGKVLDHGVCVVIVDAVFNVRAGGQARVRKEHRRNVHEFVEGCLLSVAKDALSDLDDQWIEVPYNPFYTDTFIEKATGRTVLAAKQAVLQNGSVFCHAVTFK